MKLILCPKCNDVIRLIDIKRACRCGKSWGFYKDKRNAIINSVAVPIGIDNKSLAYAVRNRALTDSELNSIKVDTFIIPYVSRTVEVKNE